MTTRKNKNIIKYDDNKYMFYRIVSRIKATPSFPFIRNFQFSFHPRQKYFFEQRVILIDDVFV
jgi:hypothetical protein